MSRIGKLFPIMDGIVFKAIPWSIIQSCEEQAICNHSQTLSRLSERGGLSPCEAVAVLEGKKYHDRWPNIYTAQQGMDAEEQLLNIVTKFYQIHDVQ